MTDQQNNYLDILHLYLSEIVAKFALPARRTLYGVTTSEKIKNTFTVIFKSIKSSFLYIKKKKYYQQQLTGKHWLYVIGNNNLNSLSFLETALEQTVYVTPYQFSQPDKSIQQLFLPNHFFSFIKNLPTFFSLLLQNKYPVKRCWDAALRATGQYEASVSLLKKHRPRAITFSNDHTIEARALLLAAKAQNIPTFYIQHACVREDFPPLKFTCSFLEGEDALRKYQQSGTIEGKVELIGVPRIDAFLSKKNNNKTVTRIGICTNLLDPIISIEPLVNALLDALPNCEITYRPHPSDSRSINFSSDRLKLSNSNKVKSFDFLLHQDFVIAGNTSIHYEAAMLNVVSVYYQFDKNSKLNDMYGFVKNKLVEKVNSIQDLTSKVENNIRQKKDMGEKARYYNSVLGTHNEGKSQDLIIQHIKQYLADKNIATKDEGA